jgi:hypothetical protein
MEILISIKNILKESNAIELRVIIDDEDVNSRNKNFE